MIKSHTDVAFNESATMGLLDVWSPVSLTCSASFKIKFFFLNKKLISISKCESYQTFIYHRGVEFVNAFS